MRSNCRTGKFCHTFFAREAALMSGRCLNIDVLDPMKKGKGESNVSHPYTDRQELARGAPSSGAGRISKYDKSARTDTELCCLPLRLRVAPPAVGISRLPEALIAVDSDGIVTAWNPGARALYGRSAKDVVGRPLNAAVGAQVDVAGILASGVGS